jgi:hypothetical protein
MNFYRPENRSVGGSIPPLGTTPSAKRWISAVLVLTPPPAGQHYDRPQE